MSKVTKKIDTVLEAKKLKKSFLDQYIELSFMKKDKAFYNWVKSGKMSYKEFMTIIEFLIEQAG